MRNTKCGKLLTLADLFLSWSLSRNGEVLFENLVEEELCWIFFSQGRDGLAGGLHR